MTATGKLEKTEKDERVIEIIPYRASLKKYFRILNEEWLNAFFSVTAEDAALLDHPEKILEEGGSIFFALMDDEVVGTCALVKESPDTFELVKMGVTGKVQGRGIGKMLLNAAEEDAKRKGALKISLETAKLLQSAIRLYERSGFIRTSDEHIHPVFKRQTFRMEKIL